MEAFPVRIQLEELICHKKGRSAGWRKTSPYMWNIFFKLDNPSIRLNEKFNIIGKGEFHFTEGSHGNLEVGHMEAGDSIDIPKAIGKWEAEVQGVEVPFFDYEFPGIVGCISVLMEQRNVSSKGAEGGHSSLNEYVRTSVNQAMSDFNVQSVDVKDIEPSIARYIDKEVAKFTDGIEKRVGGAVMQSQSLMQNLWSLLDKDELIGYQIWHFNQFEIKEAKGKIPLTARWATYAHGDWEVKGLLTTEH